MRSRTVAAVLSLLLVSAGVAETLPGPLCSPSEASVATTRAGGRSWSRPEDGGRVAASLSERLARRPWGLAPVLWIESTEPEGLRRPAPAAPAVIRWKRPLPRSQNDDPAPH